VSELDNTQGVQIKDFFVTLLPPLRLNTQYFKLNELISATG